MGRSALRDPDSLACSLLWVCSPFVITQASTRIPQVSFDSCTQPLSLTASQDGHSYHLLGESGEDRPSGEQHGVQ